MAWRSVGANNADLIRQLRGTHSWVIDSLCLIFFATEEIFCIPIDRVWCNSYRGCGPGHDCNGSKILFAPKSLHGCTTKHWSWCNNFSTSYGKIGAVKF